MMAQASAMSNWGHQLERLFAKKGALELKGSKVIKKLVKAAAAQDGAPAATVLQAQLEAFLSRGDTGFRLEGGRLMRAPPPAPMQAGSKGRPAAAGEDKPARKKKTKHGAGSEAEQQPEPAAAPLTQQAGEASSEPKKKAKKRKASDEAGEEQQQGSKQQEQGSSKRQKSAGGGAARRAASLEADGEAELDADDVAELRWRQNNKRTRVKSGPFSKAEKETLKKAVYDVAAATGQPTDDFAWLFGSSKSKETKGVWNKIAAALPHRTVKSVWAAGTRMFHEGNYQGRWTPEEDAQLLQLVSERGQRWKEIGGAVGRMPESCRDRYLSIRLGDNKKQGRWSEDETQRLQQAVQEYLAARTAAEAADGAPGELTLTLEDIEGAAAAPALDADGAPTFTVSRRVVLDDIDWSVISQAVGTRSNVQCLEKWYSQLSPSMVARGEWGSGDDRRLLRALYLSGASHDYDLDWGQLVKGRTAAQARRRWRLMVKAVEDHRDLEFDQLVNHLVDRYMPQLKQQQQQQMSKEEA